MSTFRVFLARPDTPKLSWDFVSTIVAPNATKAALYGYDKWLTENPKPAPPLLAKCRQMVNPVKQMTVVHASTVSPGQQTFISNLEKQVADKLSSQLDGTYHTVIYPPGFNYGITYGGNGYYNRATLEDIDSLLGATSDGQMDLNGSYFSTLYAKLMGAVGFGFSSADIAAMNKQDTAAAAQIASILAEFTDAGWSFSNPLPKNTSKLEDAFNQLTDKYGSLDDLPDTLSALRGAISDYKELARSSYKLKQTRSEALRRTGAAIASVTTPTADNGGMQTGDTSYYPGFNPAKLPTANQLIGGLTTPGNAVSISIAMSDFSSSSSELSIAGSAGFDFPIGGIFDVSINGSVSYDLSRYTSSSSTVTMDITYPGVTLFSSQPSAMSLDNKSGWYDNDILQEVVEKTGNDATGYQFQGGEFSVADYFGPGKRFSRLKTFVISQQPTVVLTFTGADSHRIQSDMQANWSASINLLGLFAVGETSGSYTVQSVEANSAEGTVKVTFGPPAVSGTIPIEKQIAYVLGGVAAYPPDQI
ncbi:MAG: hypothetical protein V4693_10050 [Pseudomonadota bacterium]